MIAWNVGDDIDILDANDVYCPGSVKKVSGKSKLIVHYIGWGEEWDETVTDLSRILPGGSFVRKHMTWFKFNERIPHWPSIVYIRQPKPGSEKGEAYLREENRVLVVPCGRNIIPIRPYKHGVWLRASLASQFCYRKDERTEAGLRSKYAENFSFALQEMQRMKGAVDIPFRFEGSFDSYENWKRQKDEDAAAKRKAAADRKKTAKWEAIEKTGNIREETKLLGQKDEQTRKRRRPWDTKDFGNLYTGNVDGEQYGIGAAICPSKSQKPPFRFIGSPALVRRAEAAAASINTESRSGSFDVPVRIHEETIFVHTVSERLLSAVLKSFRSVRAHVNNHAYKCGYSSVTTAGDFQLLDNVGKMTSSDDAGRLSRASQSKADKRELKNVMILHSLHGKAGPDVAKILMQYSPRQLEPLVKPLTSLANLVIPSFQGAKQPVGWRPTSEENKLTLLPSPHTLMCQGYICTTEGTTVEEDEADDLELPTGSIDFYLPPSMLKKNSKQLAASEEVSTRHKSDGDISPPTVASALVLQDHDLDPPSISGSYDVAKFGFRRRGTIGLLSSSYNAIVLGASSVSRSDTTRPLPSPFKFKMVSSATHNVSRLSSRATTVSSVPRSPSKSRKSLAPLKLTHLSAKNKECIA